MVAEDKRMESRKAYYFYKSRGICTKCGQYDAAPGRVNCEVCLAKNAERRHRKVELMSHEEKEQYLKRMSISRKNLYYKRKNAGLCTKCGKPRAENSATLCPVCLKKRHEIDRKRKKATIPRGELPSYGICYICCKNPILEGKKLCADCYEKTLVSLQLARDSDGANEAREYFRGLNRLVFMKQSGNS